MFSTISNYKIKHNSNAPVWCKIYETKLYFDTIVYGLHHNAKIRNIHIQQKTNKYKNSYLI